LWYRGKEKATCETSEHSLSVEKYAALIYMLLWSEYNYRHALELLKSFGD